LKLVDGDGLAAVQNLVAHIICAQLFPFPFSITITVAPRLFLVLIMSEAPKGGQFVQMHPWMLIVPLDDRLIVWFDIDNTLYPASVKMADKMREKIHGLHIIFHVYGTPPHLPTSLFLGTYN
jgi:hypothetical protein